MDFDHASYRENAAKETVAHFHRLDVLVNNAGIFVRTDGQDAKNYELYRQVMTINTDATVNATLAAVPHLKTTRGSIIFVSSVASSKPSALGFAYCMSKAAMSSFAKCLAIDVSPHIRVNIVSPGPVQTPIFERVGLKEADVSHLMSTTTLQKRIGTTDEIADTIYFLCSEKASFIQGHELFIDGGYLIMPSVYTAASQITQFKSSLSNKAPE